MLVASSLGGVAQLLFDFIQFGFHRLTRISPGAALVDGSLSIS
jgi:hypothetical protein